MKNFFYLICCATAMLFASCESNDLNMKNGIGVFSVAKGKKVTFSKGNLQYTQTTNTWSFAENQYDIVGNANGAGNDLGIKIDLFGWSGSTGSAEFGIGTSADFHDYSGSFVDWGVNKIGSDAPNRWRTLTSAEWDYLLNGRPYANLLKGGAQVNGVNGLILLPDNWTCPSGVTFKSGFYVFENEPGYDGESGFGLQQTFTAEQWSMLENSGAVFLPAAGMRVYASVQNVQWYGWYWSATEGDDDEDLEGYTATSIAFGSTWLSLPHEWPRVYASSVRLVMDL